MFTKEAMQLVKFRHHCFASCKKNYMKRPKMHWYLYLVLWCIQVKFLKNKMKHHLLHRCV